ncbi:metallophosphoesterase [Anaerolineales bacterium HSG25]|nr:metallophosphoesterase [Anaerolineales bacterium HSG25]
MHIAIVSDIHDNIWKLEAVSAAINQRGTECLIFCGDFCAPFTLKQLAENFEGPVHVVWGNNDGDKWLLTVIANQVGNVTLHGEFAEIEVAGRKIGVNHYPPLGRRLAESGAYDLVCYGHDHQALIETVGETVLVNPGEVMSRFGKTTFAIYDTETHTAELVEV